MANNVDRLRIAADLLQERGIILDERQLAALLGRMTRAILWIRYGDGGEPLVYAWATEGAERMKSSQPSPLADWFSQGWKIAHGITASTCEKQFTTLILEKALVG